MIPTEFRLLFADLFLFALVSSAFVFTFSKNQQKLSSGKLMKYEKCHREVGIKDLMRSFRVLCSPTFPGAKGRSYLFNSIDDIDDVSFIFNVCPIRLQNAAHSGSYCMRWKGRTYLLFWNKVCWFCHHGIRGC